MIKKRLQSLNNNNHLIIHPLQEKLFTVCLTRSPSIYVVIMIMMMMVIPVMLMMVVRMMMMLVMLAMIMISEDGNGDYYDHINNKTKHSCCST